MSDLSHFKTYKIGHAAKLLDVNTSVLRFWESEFEQLDPVRTASGQRLYTEEHLALLRCIRSLLYDEGLTIEGARRRLLDGGDAVGLAGDVPAAGAEAAHAGDLSGGGGRFHAGPDVATDAPDVGADKTVLREIRDELRALLLLLDRP